MARAFTSIRRIAAVGILLVSIISGEIAATNPITISLSQPLSDGARRVKAMSSYPHVEVSNGTPDQILILEWALRQVSTLPGRLPDVLVRFHPDDDCQGNNALYNQANHRIDFCNDGRGDFVPRQTMLHELVHAWSFEHVTPDQIDAFLDLRELDQWTPAEVAWWQSGQEQVAEILAWGLMGDRPFTSKWTRWESCRDLAAAFILVTDTLPDRPLEGCQPERLLGGSGRETNS